MSRYLIVLLANEECDNAPGRREPMSVYVFNKRENAKAFAEQEREWAPHFFVLPEPYDQGRQPAMSPAPAPAADTAQSIP
jgi:hypothetical protein